MTKFHVPETIYALIGPDGRTRYIGRTSWPLPMRLANHRGARTTPVGQWIRQVRGQVRIVALERVTWPEQQWPGAREFHWISVARRAGRDMLNRLPKVAA